MIAWEAIGQPIRLVNKQGVPCYQCDVNTEDRSGLWGDRDESPIWRSQQQTMYRWPRHHEYTFKFQTMLSDWDKDGRVGLWDVHSTGAFDGAPVCNTRDGNLEITTARDGLLYSYPIVDNSWEDWELYIHFVEDERGKLILKHNGKAVVDLNGQPTMAWNTESYFKIGLYVWTSYDPNLPSWPDGINSRRMFFTI